MLRRLLCDCRSGSMPAFGRASQHAYSCLLTSQLVCLLRLRRSSLPSTLYILHSTSKLSLALGLHSCCRALRLAGCPLRHSTHPQAELIPWACAAPPTLTAARARRTPAAQPPPSRRPAVAQPPLSRWDPAAVVRSSRGRSVNPPEQQPTTTQTLRRTADFARAKHASSHYECNSLSTDGGWSTCIGSS